MVKPYGNVLFCSVACHRETGLSRGYAFVSYDTVAEADAARAALHDYVVEGRALRCELTRQDKEVGGAKPY
jgi:RNA recognition motif-containing protein